MLSTQPYRGTRDFFPKDKRVQDFIFSRMTQTAELFGYESYNGPLLEEFDLYAAKSGEELVNKQLYSFTDQGGRHLAIRPEMTPTLARMVAKIYKEAPRPLRWFTISNLMRYERPQHGRLREHYQFNCDILGGTYPFDQMEIFQLIDHFFYQFSNKNLINIYVNNRYILETVLKHVTDNPLPFFKGIDRYLKEKETLNALLDSLNQDKKNLMNQYLNLKSFEDAINLMDSLNEPTVCESLSLFANKLKDLKLNNLLTYNPFIIRGLDYYTGTVFEIFDTDPRNPRALCGGGSYNNLLKIFNESELTTFGLGLGDVTLTAFLENHNILPDLTIPKNDILLNGPFFDLSSFLRKENFKTIMTFTTLKDSKLFNLASKRGCRFIINSNETKLLVKDIISNKESTFLNTDLEPLLQFLRT